jgi:ABC-type multidrug transport system ATPase subunit
LYYCSLLRFLVVPGKTTLLDVLAQRKRGRGVSGSIILNGGAIDSNFQLLSAYVTQEDVFVAQLSALATLEFYAALTLPARVTAEVRHDRISAVLTTLGLSHIKDTKVRNF